MHRLVRNLQLWQGDGTHEYYLFDEKVSEMWALHTEHMPTHDWMTHFIANNSPSDIIYQRAIRPMTFVTDLVLDVTDASEVRLEPPSEQPNEGSFGTCPNPDVTASGIMEEGLAAMLDRASERDNDGERSMFNCVAAFNKMYNLNLSESQGWMFMVMLKASRARGGNFQRDDYVDMAAYAALAGECASKETD